MLRWIFPYIPVPPGSRLRTVDVPESQEEIRRGVTGRIAPAAYGNAHRLQPGTPSLNFPLAAPQPLSVRCPPSGAGERSAIAPAILDTRPPRSGPLKLSEVLWASLISGTGENHGLLRSVGLWFRAGLALMFSKRRRPPARDGVEAELHELHEAVESVADAIRSLNPPLNAQSLNPRISQIFGRSHAMAVVVPVPELLDTEKITLSVMPRLANGHIDAAAVISWLSSDPAQGEAIPGTEPFVFHDPQFDEDVTCPGNFNCTATTPGTTGTFTVTCSAPGYESADFGPITYKPGVPRSLNASVGSPVSDL